MKEYTQKWNLYPNNNSGGGGSYCVPNLRDSFNNNSFLDFMSENGEGGASCRPGGKPGNIKDICEYIEGDN